MIMEYSDVGIFEVDYLYETEEGFFCIILDIHGTMGNISIDVGDYVNFSKEQTITFKEWIDGVSPHEQASFPILNDDLPY